MSRGCKRTILLQFLAYPHNQVHANSQLIIGIILLRQRLPCPDRIPQVHVIAVGVVFIQLVELLLENKQLGL